MTIEQLDRVCERWRDATTPRQQTISGAFPKGYFESDQLIEQRYLAVYQLPLLAHELRKAMNRENRENRESRESREKQIIPATPPSDA